MRLHGFVGVGRLGVCAGVGICDGGVRLHGFVGVGRLDVCAVVVCI